MRIPAIASCLLIAASAVAAPPSTPDKILAGRTPGKPVSCIQQNFVDDSRIFDNGSILYKMKGGPDYLNTPHECTALRSDRGIVTKTTGTSLCSGDLIDVVDFTSHFDYGACPLGEFVPYPRAKR
jgi:hypothetical protein